MSNSKNGSAGQSTKESAMLVVKGFIIGSSMSVPGVSGGTMAILLGIYDKMLRAVSTFFKNIKQNSLFLIKVAAGGILGIGTLSFVIGWLLERMPVPVSFFFIGAVAGGIPVLLHEIQKGRQERTGSEKGSIPDNIRTVVCFLAGVVCVFAVTFLPQNAISVTMELSVQSVLSWGLTGIIVALALVLPGISTSHMLVVLGMYEDTLNAVRHADVLYLACLAAATLIGVFLTTKPLEWMLRRFTWESYSLILGFVAGSLQAVFTEIIIPKWPESPDMKWFVYTGITSVVLFVAGVLFIRGIERKMKNV